MENLKNLPPFYEGQQVVYLTGINAPKNSIHTIREIIKMPCGCWFLDINKTIIGRVEAEYVYCADHQSDAVKKTRITSYWNSKSFAPLQQSKFPLIEYREVIEKERQLITAN